MLLDLRLAALDFAAVGLALAPLLPGLVVIERSVFRLRRAWHVSALVVRIFASTGVLGESVRIRVLCGARIVDSRLLA